MDENVAPVKSAKREPADFLEKGVWSTWKTCFWSFLQVKTDLNYFELKKIMSHSFFQTF